MAGSPARINRSAITGSWSIACWVIVALTSVALGRPVAGAAASIRVNVGSQSWSTAGHATCGADVATVISPAALAKLEAGSALGRRREYRSGGERVNRHRRFTYVGGVRYGGTTTTSIATNHIHGEGAYYHRLLIPSRSASSFVAENDLNATRGGGKVGEAAKAIEKYLGPGARATRNEAGDLVVESADSARKVRFDLEHPSPHSNPHAHVEEFERVKNKLVPTYKSGPVYPTDVPHE